MKHLRKRLMAIFLAAVMIVTSVGTSAYAYEADKPGNLSVTGKDGETVEEDESWEEKFPNGTFAFKHDSTTIEEGKNAKEQKITIYRLGGTKGKATAKVAIAPAVAALDEEEKEYVYANAASNTDYTVKVENPIGADGTIGKQQVSSTYELKEETKDGKITLSLKGAKGEYVRYFWHVKKDGQWEAISGAENDTLSVSEKEYKENEYICVVEADYKLSLSQSTGEEASQKLWINLNSRHITDENTYEKGSYTDVSLDQNMPYKTSFLQVDFEEGEWVKDIIVKATDDEEHEAEELASFTIYEVEGATFTESANRFSMCIKDDEEKLDSTMGFALSQVRVDKSTGKAKIKLTRTGATQYVSSVDYVTVDGTAKAGKDYAKAESTASFSGGIERTEIEIQLLDNKEKTDEDVYFTIQLKNAKGGNIKEKAQEIRVNLFNTNTSDKDNLATASKSKEAKDASDRVKESKDAITKTDDKEVKAEAVEKKESEIKLKKVTDEDGDMSAQSDTVYTYSMSPSGSSSWSGTCNLLSSYTAYDENGNAKDISSNLLQTDYRANTYFDLGDMTNQFSSLSGSFSSKTSYSLYWAREYYSGLVVGIGNSSFARNLTEYTSSSGDGNMRDRVNSEAQKGVYTIHTQFDKLTKDNEFNVNLDSISNVSNATHLVFKSVISKRGDTVRPRETKVYSPNFTLTRRALSKAPTVYVNTGDNEDKDRLNNSTNTDVKTIRSGLKPYISIVNGGFNGSKNIFMGSELKVAQSDTTGVYKLDTVELKAGSNTISKTNNVNKSTNVKFSNGNQRLSTTDNYSLNLEYNRYQSVLINCKTSMTEADDDEAKQKKLDKILKNVRVNDSDIAWTTDNSEFTHTSSGTIKNFSKINFGLNDGTKILYDNKVYDGAADIPMSDADIATNTITFSVYTPDAVSVVRDPEILAEKSVCLYKDKDKNGVYTPEGDGTNPVKILRPGEPYKITDFGKDILLKVDFTVQPASLNIPPGATGKETFQVIPGFVTTQTSEEQKQKMTDEEKSYRDISTKDGKVKMYGAVSQGTVSFLSGYDASPAKMNSSTKKYEWKPDWKGNLRTGYESPAKIKVYETKMPNGFVAASSKDEINNYLGCFHGNETYYITSRLTSDSKEKITSTKRGGFYTLPEPAAQAFESEEASPAVAPDDTDGTTSNQPDIANTSPGVSLPELNIGLGYGTFMMGDDEIGFSVGTPIFGSSSENGGAAEKDWMGSQGLNDMKEAMSSPNNNIFKQLRKQAGRSDGTGNTGRPAQASPLKNKAVGVDIAVNMSFLWKYSKLTGKYEFSSAMIALSIEGSIRLQYRFNVCPIFYVYVQVGMGLEAQTGIEMEKEEVKNPDGTTSIKNNVSFAGLSLNPKLYVEAGAGVGVDLAKLDIYVKVSVSFAFTINKKSQVDEFITSAAVGFRVVFLFFSYEMDVVGCKAGYDRSREEDGKKPWFFSWQLCGRDMGGTEEEELDVDVAGAPVSVSKPKNVFRLQNINSSNDNAQTDDMSAQAYDVDGIDEFQVSGYGNNASAVELGSGFDSASDYRLLTVNDTNYVLYTISRKNPGHSLNNTQLVMSKISTTSTGEGGEEGKDSMGLVNPIDESSSTKYIVVDRKDGAEEGTGDLDYHAIVENGKIKVTWTSYLASAAQTIPESTDSDEMLKKASQLVEVKTAEFDTETPAEFTDATVLSEGEGYRFLPSGSTSDVHLFADTKAYTDAEMAEREQAYQEKYEQDAQGNNTNDQSGTGDPYAKANYQYALTTDYLYGKYSKLHYSVKQADGTYKTYDLEPTQEWKDQGTRLENVQITEGTDDNYFLSYTTEQKDTFGADNEYAKIKKMYVQKASIETGSEETGEGTKETRDLKFSTPILLKTLVDYEDSDDNDGVYVNGSCEEKVDSPNFTNLKFLHGKLSNSGSAETFLLYNMNGITYVINEENLKNALNSSTATITVDPLFTIDEERGNSQAEATIGVDGDGNISAVYTQTVANTVNNALYVTKYDPTVKKFGEAFMLAMNHMQVYEDNVSQDLASEDAQAAFFDEKKGGGEDQFIFNSPQIALGKPTEGNQAGTLTILTKGTMTQLKKATMDFDGKEYTEYVPDTSKSATAGIYAITYGIGEQKIGEASIRFDQNNFVAGETLTGSVSFRNTGDVAIRGSKANPVYITLKASGKDGGEATELAQWKVEKNILAGQQVTTDDVTTRALPSDIAGGYIYFEVQEDPSYSSAKVLSTADDEDGAGKIVVGEKAELSIDDLQVTAGDNLEKRTVNNISCVLADIEMTVSNQGVENASDVQFEVKRTSGKTDGSEDKYVPLEIGGTLVMSDDGAENVLLGNGNDSGLFDYLGYTDTAGTVSSNKSIAAGTTQKIKGKMLIPLSAFDPEDAVGAVNLQFKLKSSAAEYESKNNIICGKVVPATRFDCLDKVSLTVGNPVNFSLKTQAAMDSSKRSNITLTEMKLNKEGVAEETDNKLLASAAYNVKTGYVTVTAQKEGSGVLRIADTTTGSFKDITFVSTVSGCNIRTDNPVFEFTNTVGGQQWKDEDIGSVKEGTVLPYNSDICTGGEGNTFTFTTYARSIDFFYTGDVEISSNNSFGYTTKQYKDRDGEDTGEYYKCHTVDFNNRSLKKHTVTVKVINGSASFDRMVEYYADRSEGDTGRDVPEDSVKPNIVIGKTLPKEFTKLQPGTSFEIPVYIYDNVMLNSVSIGGNGADEMVNNQFAKGTLKIKKNGTYHVIVEDSSGNIAQQQIVIDSFDEEAEKTDEKTDDWPSISMKLVNQDGEEIKDYTTANAYIQYSIKADRKIQSVKIQKVDMNTNKATNLGSGITVSGTPTELSDTYETNLSENGYYQMKVEDAAGNITTSILYVQYLTKGPNVSLYTAEDAENTLFYCVGDEDNEITIKEMAVYEGKVTAQIADGVIKVEDKEPLFHKDYTSGTMDSGSVALAPSITTKEFTIVVQDITGNMTTYIYTDETCLNSLAVGNAEDIAYGVQLTEEFKPYKRNYTVDVPYGYPELQVPEVYAVGGNGVTISKNWDGDVLTIKVQKGDLENEYTITLKRKICTCGISLRTFDEIVNVPKTGEKPSRRMDVQTDVTLCEVHDEHRQENIQYSYKIVDIDYVGADETETPGTESATIESATTETPATETPGIESALAEIAKIQGDKVVFNRIPEGEKPVEVKVKVTAKTDSCEESQIITYSVRNKYDLGLYVTAGGKVQCGEDTLFAQSESAAVESGNMENPGDEPYYYDANTGYTLDLLATEKEGYEFVGWYNSDNELLSNEKDFDYVVGRDDTLRALFKDIVDPTGSITITDKSGTNNYMKSEEGDILVSSAGFNIDIEGQDEPSGVKSISYQIVKKGETFDEDGQWIPYEGTPVVVEDDMDFVVYAKIVDMDDNTIILHSDRAMVEKSFAKVNLAPNFTEGTFTNKKDAAIVATVQRGTAPLKETCYIVNGEEFTTQETVFGIDELLDGIYEVKVIATDIFGKEVFAKVDVKKDTANPVLTITGIPEKAVEKATLTIQTDGGLSGVKEVRVNGKSYDKETYEVTENGTYLFELENNAGTTVTETVSIEQIVKPTPTPTPTATPTATPEATSTPTIVPSATPGPDTTTPPTQTNEPVGPTVAPARKGALPTTSFVRKQNVGKKGVRITWKGVKNAVSYNVYCSKTENGKYKLVANVKESSYISTKKNARKYYYKIVAVAKKKKNNSDMSACAVYVIINKDAVAVGPTIPVLKGKVTNVKAKAKKGKITVSWKKHKKATSYIVYRAESKYGIFDEYAVVKTKKFKDTYVVKGRKYYYKVRAVREKGGKKSQTDISRKAQTKAK